VLSGGENAVILTGGDGETRVLREGYKRTYGIIERTQLGVDDH